MTTTEDYPATTHMSWCTEHRDGDANDPGYCTGPMTHIGNVSICLDQDVPGGEPRIYLAEGTSQSESLSLDESRQLRMVLEQLEQQTGTVISSDVAAYLAEMTELAAERGKALAKANAGSIPPCPAWCSMPPGHEWDSVDAAGRPERDHIGPDVGPWASSSAREVLGREGLEHEVAVEVPGDVCADVAQLRQIAASITAAADWLEARA